MPPAQFPKLSLHPGRLERSFPRHEIVGQLEGKRLRCPCFCCCCLGPSAFCASGIRVQHVALCTKNLLPFCSRSSCKPGGLGKRAKEAGMGVRGGGGGGEIKAQPSIGIDRRVCCCCCGSTYRGACAPACAVCRAFHEGKNWYKGSRNSLRRVFVAAAAIAVVGGGGAACSFVSQKAWGEGWGWGRGGGCSGLF